MKRERKKQAGGRLQAWLNDLSVRKKMGALFLFCVLLPLIVTDSIVVGMLSGYQKAQLRHDTASAAVYYLSGEVNGASDMAQNIYLNQYLNDFLNTEFDSPLDFYGRYRQLLQDSLLESSIGTSGVTITMYADNPTLINGGKFRRIETVEASPWYRAMSAGDQNVLISAYFDNSHVTTMTDQRRISLVRRMNYYQRDPYEKLVKVDLDYSDINQSLRAANYEADVYVCENGTILFSNAQYASVGTPFVPMPAELLKKSRYSQELGIYGSRWEVYVVDRQADLLQFAWKNRLPILLLLLLNLLLPSVLISMLNRSFVDRLQRLSQTFDRADADKMRIVENVQGRDEIGTLMRNYNKMATRTNDLIETVYKGRLREQENDIARQRAELLAMRSQINPHFLFNALESVRMRSLLKKETETAKMIGRLAVIERQYVDWSADTIPVAEELDYVKAYMELQEYRFGDRFAYKIELSPDCEGLCIPKLTVLTFVENACLHGVAGKTGHCWVFVRVLRRDGAPCLEVEDTGIGMEEAERKALEDKMNHANIEMLRSKEHIGIVNACLRLKIAFRDEVRFTVESEPGIGFTVTAILPKAGQKTTGKNNEEGTSHAAGSAGR